MTTRIPIGPPGLGLELGADTTVSGDGWLVRDLVIPMGLDGPPGILQGGLAAGICIGVACAADRHGAPLTSLHARLHAPTPLGTTLVARVRGADAIARYEVELRDGVRLLVSAEVELAGHESTSRAFDLLELADVPLPDPIPQEDYASCFVCGPRPDHPLGQRLHPRYRGTDAVVIPWLADDDFADARGAVDPLVVAAVLDCPTAWASMSHVRAQGDGGLLLAGYHLQILRDAPVMEVLRTVARFDGADGRKIRARGALVDDEGVTYAIASALHIRVTDLPEPPGV